MMKKTRGPKSRWTVPLMLFDMHTQSSFFLTLYDDHYLLHYSSLTHINFCFTVQQLLQSVTMPNTYLYFFRTKDSICGNFSKLFSIEKLNNILSSFSDILEHR